MTDRFENLKIGRSFTKCGFDVSTPTFMKIEFIEIRNLDGKTWWANAINRTTGELVLFEDDNEVVI